MYLSIPYSVVLETFSYPLSYVNTSLYVQAKTFPYPIYNILSFCLNFLSCCPVEILNKAMDHGIPNFMSISYENVSIIQGCDDG